MNENKPRSRWLPAAALAVALLCILTAIGTPLPGLGRSAGAKGGRTAARAASVERPDALHMAGLSLEQLDDAQGLAAPHGLGRGSSSIVYVSRRLQTRTEEVPCGTRYVGVEQPGKQPYVVSAGTAGQKVVTYNLTLHDGVEVSREKVGEEITRQPVEQVVCRGAGGELVAGGKSYSYSKVLNMRATAYTTENKSWKWTASGTTARVGAVAVDKSVVPLGSRLYIVAPDGSWCYGVAVAEDTGVRGSTIDLYFNTRRECINFGVRAATVYVLTD